jgi:hypothetical protein
MAEPINLPARGSRARILAGLAPALGLRIVAKTGHADLLPAIAPPERREVRATFVLTAQGRAQEGAQLLGVHILLPEIQSRFRASDFVSAGCDAIAGEPA